MNVEELNRLSAWYTGHFSEINNLFSKLIQPIQHNATQANKQTLETQLDDLINYIQNIGFENLSIEQINFLDNVGVLRFLGLKGAIYVESAVRTSNYDPQTALNKLNEALNALTAANNGMSLYRQSADMLGFIDADQGDVEGITIRVGFREGAAINNVSDLREAGKDWYDIIRGIALAANEAPEDTLITGASNGSIILTLIGTAAVTKILAIIGKNVASMVKDAIEIANQIEDLRGKKLLNNSIEKELKKIEQAKKETASAATIKEISDELPELDGEKIAALELSVKKLLLFNEKGGDVDFVSHEEGGSEDVAEGRDEGSANAALSQAMAAIREYQKVREHIRLLEDKSQ